MNRSFCSKILIFGEYTIIKKSMALATPYQLFDGYLTFPSSQDSMKKDNDLNFLIKYLKNCKKLSFEFDLSAFEFDVAQGLYFKSTIPRGVGMGSSAALTAAIYNRYGRSEEKSIPQLKKNMAFIESYFHGSSSGIDPLICYLNKSILLTQEQKNREVIIPDYSQGKGGLFLLNTGQSRKTEPLG